MTHPVSDSMVKEVLDKKLEQNPEQCPLCGGKIDTTISTMHDRECIDCSTKFTMRTVETDDSDYDRHVPSVEMRTTPVRRIKRKLYQKANERAVMDHLREEAEQ